MENRKTSIIILAIFLLGLAGWWFWGARSLQTDESRLERRPVQITQSPASGLSPTILNALHTPEQVRMGHAINAMLTRNPNAVIPMAQLVAAGVSKEDLTKGILDAENAIHLALYGKVVDQYGAPVVGAKMRGNVLINVGIEDSGSKNYYTETDSKGLFNFTGLHGANFGVEPQKEGYEYTEKGSVNWTKDYKPDPANPVVFTMWKLQGAEPMVHRDFHFLIPCDGTPTNVNLMMGKAVTSGGDMTITFTRNPIQIHRGTPFEWSLTLTVPGGGLAEIHDSYPYEAPENGYQDTTTLGTGPQPKQYASSVGKDFYFKAAGGKYYGRMTIKLQTDFQPPPTFVHIDIYLNPSGSRNLEFDGAKEITSKGPGQGQAAP